VCLRPYVAADKCLISFTSVATNWHCRVSPKVDWCLQISNILLTALVLVLPPITIALLRFWLKFAFGQVSAPTYTHTYHLCSYFRSEKTLICQVKLVRFLEVRETETRHYQAGNQSVNQSINQSITAGERHSRGTSDRYISWRYSARARKIIMLQECQRYRAIYLRKLPR